MSRPALLLAPLLFYASAASAQPAPAPAPKSAPAPVSDEAGDELQDLTKTVRQSFTDVEIVPVDTSYAEEAAAGDQAAHARFSRLQITVEDLRNLQTAARPESGTPNPTTVETLVRKVAGDLNDQAAPGQPPIDPQPLIQAYLHVAVGPRSPDPEAARSRLAPLVAQSRQLQDILGSGAAPSVIAARVDALMDGLSRRRDLGTLVNTPEYRQIVSAVDSGLARATAGSSLPPEQTLALNTRRTALDSRLSDLALKAVPAPGHAPEAPAAASASRWSDVTVAFHAALRNLFPETADVIWSRLLDRGGPRADPQKVAAYEAAIEGAKPEFLASFGHVPSSVKGSAFVDGFDAGYHYRVGHDDSEHVHQGALETWGAGTPARVAEQIAKYRSFSILPDYVADSAQQMTQGTLRAMGMMKNAAPDQMITPKHFPGGPPELEMTEDRVVYVPGGFKELAPYIAPFLAVLPMKPPEMMISHVTYPDWDKELRAQFPNVPALACGGCVYPASLSPYVIRGYLKDGLQYKGQAVADWMDMGAVNAFVKQIKPSLSPALRSTDNYSLIIILGVYSGLNWITGFSSGVLKGTAFGVYDYYEQDAGFRVLFDGLVAETARLRGVPEPKADVTPVKAGEVPPWFMAKLEVITRASSAIDTHHWSDIWSRNGLLTLSFRVSILNSLNHTQYPNLSAFRAKHPGDTAAAEDDWVKTLQGDASFVKAYTAVPWDGPDMRAAFQEFMKTMYTPAAGRSAT
jgi:hypothetical protein